MPHQIKAWTKQRTRWLKGFMLTALVHTRNPIRTWRSFGRAGTMTLLAFMVGTPLLYLAQTASLVIWASGYHGLFAPNLYVGTVLMVVQLLTLVVFTTLALVAARRHRLSSAVSAPLSAGVLADAVDGHLAGAASVDRRTLPVRKKTAHSAAASA